MRKPVIIVNFKAYEQALGAKAVRLAKMCAEVCKKTGVAVAVCVQPTDVYRVSSAVKIPVLSQHVDAVHTGAHTGWLVPEALKQAKGAGSLINHSEHKISFDAIKRNVLGLKKLKMTTIVCAGTPRKALTAASLTPDFIAYEPPALIGGKISVSDAKPSIIASLAKKLRGRLLVGAGVHNSHDVCAALEYGAAGVLVASGVVKAENPRKALVDLCKGAKSYTTST